MTYQQTLKPWSFPGARELSTLALLTLVLTVSVLPAVLADNRQYTWSLTIFVLPAALLTGWLWLSSGPRQNIDRRAVASSLAILLPMGLILDLFLADELFHFHNREAVVGIYLPAFDLFEVDDAQAIPIEELAFYAFGFLFMLLGYSWSSQYLGGRRPSRPRRPRVWSAAPALPPLCGLLLWAAAGTEVLPRTPTYLVYLLVVPATVTVALLPGVFHRIDWRAYTLTAGTIACLSFLWEAVLAIPNGWWGYRPEAMIGLFVAPQLPVEAVAVWLLAPLTSVVVLETLRRRYTS